MFKTTWLTLLGETVPPSLIGGSVRISGSKVHHWAWVAAHKLMLPVVADGPARQFPERGGCNPLPGALVAHETGVDVPQGVSPDAWLVLFR